MEWVCRQCGGKHFKVSGEIEKELFFDENENVINEKIISDYTVLKCMFCGNETRSKRIKVIAKIVEDGKVTLVR